MWKAQSTKRTASGRRRCWERVDFVPGCVAAAAAWRPSPGEWGTFYDYYVDIIMLFSRLV